MQIEKLRSATTDGNKWTLLQLQERWDAILLSSVAAAPTQDIDECLEHLGFARIDSVLGITIALQTEQ